MLLNVQMNTWTTEEVLSERRVWPTPHWEEKAIVKKADFSLQLHMLNSLFWKHAFVMQLNNYFKVWRKEKEEQNPRKPWLL